MAKLVRWLMVCCVSAGALAVVTLIAPPSGASSGVTFFSFVSAPGDHVGGGATRTITPTTELTFTPSGTFGGVDVAILDTNLSHLESWDIEFAPPVGSVLVPGSYTNAERDPFNDTGHPGLSVGGNGAGCNKVYGSFVINSVQFDAFGTMTELDASFVQHCDSPTAPPLRGIVKYNAPTAAPLQLDVTQPSAVIGELTTFAARVAPNGTAPTGNVSFLDGTTVLGTMPLRAGGFAVLTTYKLGSGTHSITAVYPGDALHPAATSPPTTQTVSAPTTSFWVLSIAGDHIGLGARASYTPATATINLTGGLTGFQMSVSVSTQTELWFIEIAPPTGQHLQPGTYTNARSVADPTHPQVAVSGGDQGCNTATGELVITAIKSDAGSITSLTGVFVQYCDGSPVSPLLGVIRWNA